MLGRPVFEVRSSVFFWFSFAGRTQGSGSSKIGFECVSVYEARFGVVRVRVRGLFGCVRSSMFGLGLESSKFLGSAQH